jgi:hypothetical protein
VGFPGFQDRRAGFISSVACEGIAGRCTLNELHCSFVVKFLNRYRSRQDFPFHYKVICETLFRETALPSPGPFYLQLSTVRIAGLFVMSAWSMLASAFCRGRRVPRTGFKQLTSKIGPRNFYKGKGCAPTGRHTRKGELILFEGVPALKRMSVWVGRVEFKTRSEDED